MDNQTKESKDLKFRQWADSIQPTENKTSKKTVKKPAEPISSKTSASGKSAPTPTREGPRGEEDREEEEDFEEREGRRNRENRSSRKRTVVAPRPPKSRKRGSPVLIAIIIFLLAIIVFLVLFIVLGKAGKTDKVSEEPANEIAVDLPSDPADNQGTSPMANTATEAQPSGITLVVPAEYALYGRTDYRSMTQAEYDQLLSGVRQYIAVQLKAFTLEKDPYYPHFTLVTANDDCTVYTVTVNEAGVVSPKEKALPEQLSFFTKMYAAYSQQSVPQFEIQYQTWNGRILKTETFTLDGAAINTAAPVTPAPTAAVPAATPAEAAPEREHLP